MILTPEINMSTTDAAFFVLLTVSNSDGTETERFVNNNEPVVSRGDTFQAYPFTIVMPLDDPDQPPQAQLVIDNVDQRITEYIRAMLLPPIFKIEVVISTAPDIVERTIDFLTMSNASYDAQQVTATLAPFDTLHLPAIDSIYSGEEFPDLVY